MSRLHTLKGTIGAGPASRQLVVDDGRFQHGFVIDSFRVWGVPLVIGANVSAVLSTSPTAPATMNAEESGVFAWAATINDTTNGFYEWNIIDPQHVINEELYLHNLGAGANYLINMRAINMTPEQGVLQLVKNLGQA